MTDVLNFYLQKYGLLEPKASDPKIDSNEKAKERWDLLRKSIRSVSELIDKEDLKNNKVSHGIQFLRRITNDFKIDQATYLPGKNSYITLDGNSVRLFDTDGKYQESISYEKIGVPFSRLQWANVSVRFVAWSPGLPKLAMLDGRFRVLEILDEIIEEDPIYELCYNEDKNEIISSHSNKLITWQFRYANKHLIPKVNINLNIKGNVATIFHLERTQSKFQRLFVVNDCGVIIVRLSDGVVIKEHPQMHERPITALTFFNPLKLLVSGCRDGSIKVWSPLDRVMELRMVFVGHTAPVTSLALFPGGCQATVASSGSDKTLRVWSLEINDEIECVELDYSPIFIGSDLSKISFFTMDQNFVDIWQQNHILDDLLTLPSPATQMQVSLADNVVVVSCNNSLLFMASPETSCDLLTKTMVSRQHVPEIEKKEKIKILSSVLLEEIQVLFVLINRNIILQYNPQSHPMTLKRKSLCTIDERLLMLALYKIENEKDSRSKNKSMLMSGSSNGSILVHDIFEPETILLKVDAHSGSPVVCLIANTLNCKVFSSGHDNSVKIWHVYPFAAESLTRELSFFCGHLPIHLANIDNHLFTVFHDVDGAQYPTVIYNIQDSSRYDHSPNDDHIESVNSVSASRRMKLFLSSSSGSENLIKIWTCKNVLLRQIEVHFPINCSVFSSERADILVSVGNQICKISHAVYLPKGYIKKQVLMHFETISPGKTRKMIECNDDEFHRMFQSSEREMLKGIRSVFKYQHYKDTLPDTEAEEVAQRNIVITESFEKIQSTESDIRRLQLGQCEKTRKKYEKFIETPKEADILRAYLSEFMKLCNIPLPKDNLEDTGDGTKPKKYEKYRDCDKVGFFPSYKSVSKEVASSCTNINPAGYIPNSTILNQIWPAELIKEQADVWKPVMLSSLDLALSRAKAFVETEEESPRFFDWGSDDEQEVQESPKSSKSTRKLSTELSADVLSKYSSLLKDDTVEVMETIKLEPETPKDVVKRPVSTKITREALKLPTISRTPATMPDLRKVTFQPTPSPQPVEVVKETGPHPPVTVEISARIDSSFFITQSPSKSERMSESILPQFLLRFSRERWFQSFCPPPHDQEVCLTHLTKPLTATNFCKQLIQLIEEGKDIEDLISFVKAIEHLYSEEDIEKATVMNIHSLLDRKVNDIKQLDSDEKIDLLKVCLKVMVTLEGVPDRSVVLICLSRYFDANDELRLFMKSLLCHLGLEDDEDIIGKEMDNFKLFNIQVGSQRISDLQAMVSEWLQKCYQSTLNFADDCRKIIGEEIHLLDSKFSKPSKKVASCLERVLNIFHLNITNPIDFMQLYPVEKCSKSVLTYVNCLNYVRFKVSLKKKKLQVSKGPSAVEESEGPKKTIVSLPKINPNKQCLVRLGESNADKISIAKRNDFSLLNSMWSKTVIADQTQHPALQPFYHYQIAVGGGFVPYMHLHMKPCLVNPFPRQEDIDEWEAVNSKSLFLCAKQSFIPQFSLPPEPF